MTLLALSTTQTVAAVLVPVAAVCVIVAFHHLVIDWRARRTHHRALELARTRTAAHQARHRARDAGDEAYAAAVRAERDEAHRLVVGLLHQLDQEKARAARAEAERDSARAWGQKLEKDRFALTTFSIELDQTRQLPVLPPVDQGVTLELPVVPGNVRALPRRATA